MRYAQVAGATIRLVVGAWLAAVVCGRVHAAQKPIVHLPADGNLSARDAAGRATQASCTNPSALRYVPGRRGQGVTIPARAIVTVPVPGFNPKEGTLSFWFRPDWSPNTLTPFVMFEINTGRTCHLRFRRGFTAPDHCYLQMGNRFPCSFGSFNLFTANTWRHYALRWSVKRGRVQFVVDGDARGESGRRRMGKFTCDVAGPARAALLLHGWSRGAFDDVKVFDRYLTVPELITEAGLTRVARYLQEQAPPPGGASSSVPEQTVSYVDPTTGKTVTVPVIQDEDALRRDTYSAQSATYNPARMPQLRATPHTKWARPLAGGPVRVLFVMPTGFYDHQSPLREAVELWQRLEMDCDVTDKPDPAVLAKDYDVIAFTYQGWTASGRPGHPFGPRGWLDIDERLRTWVLKRVTSGASGLVYAHPVPKRSGRQF